MSICSCREGRRSFLGASIGVLEQRARAASWPTERPVCAWRRPYSCRPSLCEAPGPGRAASRPHCTRAFLGGRLEASPPTAPGPSIRAPARPLSGRRLHSGLAPCPPAAPRLPARRDSRPASRTRTCAYRLLTHSTPHLLPRRPPRQRSRAHARGCLRSTPHPAARHLLAPAPPQQRQQQQQQPWQPPWTRT